MLKGGEDASFKIGNLLRFAEESLGKKQELTAMLTSSLMNEDFVTFLTLFGCDEFYRLNDELLIGGENEALRRKALGALGAKQTV